LFFANAEDFRRRALAAADQCEGDLHWFVLNMEANVEVDITALDAVEAVREELTGRGAIFALARVKQDLHASLLAYSLVKRIGPEHIYPTLPTAVDAYEQCAPGTPDRASRPATRGWTGPVNRASARWTGGPRPHGDGPTRGRRDGTVRSRVYVDSLSDEGVAQRVGTAPGECFGSVATTPRVVATTWGVVQV
jgi:hypothetical protein